MQFSDVNSLSRKELKNYAKAENVRGWVDKYADLAQKLDGSSADLNPAPDRVALADARTSYKFNNDWDWHVGFTYARCAPGSFNAEVVLRAELPDNCLPILGSGEPGNRNLEVAMETGPEKISYYRRQGCTEERVTTDKGGTILSYDDAWRLGPLRF